MKGMSRGFSMPRAIIIPLSEGRLTGMNSLTSIITGVRRKILITTPIILSAIAASALVKHYEWIAGSAAMLAGIFPAVLRALELDKDLAARITTVPTEFSKGIEAAMKGTAA